MPVGALGRALTGGGGKDFILFPVETHDHPSWREPGAGPCLVRKPLMPVVSALAAKMPSLYRQQSNGLSLSRAHI
jgi:hypothetical protein